MKKFKIALFTLALATSFISCTSDSSTEETETETETTTDEEFVITSEAVSNFELLEEYQCEEKVDGVENSIPLAWSGVPEGTVSLAINMTHIPNTEEATINSYLILWDIDPTVSEIPYGIADDGPWFMGANKDENTISYSSPCSPSTGSHEYTITIYALSETPADLPSNSSVEVNYETFSAALETVTIIDTASLTFDSITP